jgi:hypothetical protein
MMELKNGCERRIVIARMGGKGGRTFLIKELNNLRTNIWELETKQSV